MTLKANAFALILAATFTLMACSPKEGDTAGGEVTIPQAPSVELDRGANDAPEQPAMASLPGTALAVMPADFDRLSAPDTVTLTLEGDVARVTGGRERLSAGGIIKAARVTLDGDKEQMMSGKSVTIHIHASSPTSSPMRAAYSTNETGNSGWRDFTLTTQPQDFEFDYDVPQMEQGKKDYIGVLPVDPAQVIHIHRIAYTIKN